ncbi:MAG TPA: GDSL-type esterase/lipase family protein, partial [Solirubrobacteraceae bacterium]
SIRKAGEEMNPGVGRDAVLAVGHPAAWIANQLPLSSAAHTMTAWLSPNLNLSGLGGFNETVANGADLGIPPVTPDAFAPAQIGAPAAPKKPLHTLLVTGDSMSEPLDQYIAQALAPDGVRVIQDPHIGTGISSTVLVDWAKLSAYQVNHDHPDAVVVFIGANDGYAMPGPGGKLVNCCSAEWAAIYAGRVRRMMNTYRQAGVARVYWLTLPTPRDSGRARISLVVNAAINVAAQPWADEVHVIDTVPVFTPGNRYRDSMTINGAPTIVRESDGIHLNDAGSQLAAKIVLGDVDDDFTR